MRPRTARRGGALGGVVWLELGIGVGTTFIAGAVATLVAHRAIVDLPPDALSSGRANASPVRKAGGYALVVAGLFGLVLPGPGWALIVLGLAILGPQPDSRLSRWVFGSPRVLSTVNALRARAGRPALEPPRRDAEPGAASGGDDPSR